MAVRCLAVGSKNELLQLPLAMEALCDALILPAWACFAWIYKRGSTSPTRTDCCRQVNAESLVAREKVKMQCTGQFLQDGCIHKWRRPSLLQRQKQKETAKQCRVHTACVCACLLSRWR
eukprot:jgi/Ulvmu1/1340/UM011_0068.1